MHETWLAKRAYLSGQIKKKEMGRKCFFHSCLSSRRLTQAATSAVGCPAARHAGAFDPSNTAQVAASRAVLEKGGSAPFKQAAYATSI